MMFLILAGTRRVKGTRLSSGINFGVSRRLRATVISPRFVILRAQRWQKKRPRGSA